MTGSTATAPWFLARSAQLAVAAAAAADLVRAVTLRAHLLHPEDTPLSTFGQVSEVYVYVLTAAAAVFLTWFSRCRRNAVLLSPGAVPGSAVWAVLAWLLPVFQLWVPRGLVLDVHRASGRGAAPRSEEVLVNVWWAAWIAHTVILAAGTALGAGTSLPLLVVTQALDLAAAALAITVVQRVTARQAAGLGAGIPVPTPADLPHAP
ncbi:DUF4328 domain-containing protein [Streptomyces sp. NPDC004561]